MRSTPGLDSTISSFLKQLKGCAARVAGHYCFPSAAFAKAAAGRQNCGCSSVVEHLLAKEDVASSSLVTRSSPVAASLCEAPRRLVKHTRAASSTRLRRATALQAGRRLQPATAANISACSSHDYSSRIWHYENDITLFLRARRGSAR